MVVLVFCPTDNTIVLRLSRKGQPVRDAAVLAVPSQERFTPWTRPAFMVYLAAPSL